jgi:hypothetical protein
MNREDQRRQTEQNLQRMGAAFERIKSIVSTPAYLERGQALAIEGQQFDENQRAIQRRVRLEESGILERYWSILDLPDATEALTLMESLLSGPPPFTFLVLAGPAGRGKSAALSIAVWRAGGFYYDAQELLRESTFDASLWHRLQAAPFLALDELGAEATNPAWEANLFDLLNGRDARLRKTAIATNLNAAAFRERYASAGLQRLMDRILTAGEFKILPGKSLRVHWSETEDSE